MNFTIEDGLVGDAVFSILEDREGNLWFGTREGVSRYDGKEFVNFTIEDGLGDNLIWSILEDREGNLWFGTGGGVSRYDGKKFVNFTIEDGLGGNIVRSILEDREGHMWFGTYGGGVSRYDGSIFQNLLHRDGLIHNNVRQVLQDRNGDIWIGTDDGVTCYHPGKILPSIRIADVFTDRSHGSVSEVRLPVLQRHLSFVMQGTSFRTRPGAMVYLYRLKGYNEEWQQTRANRVEYTALPVGQYEFQVKAVDRDLNYTEESATVSVEVFYQPVHDFR